MRIERQHLYHGAALTQIVEHGSFKALNRLDERYGHYQVNHDKRILIRYRSNSNPPWSFSLLPHDIETILNDHQAGVATYLCFVCGDNTICVLDVEQLNTIVDMDANTPQTIRIRLPEGCSMRVSGPTGTLPRTIPHSAFPAVLFE